MDAQQIIDFIKQVLRSKAQAQPEITISFFEEKRREIFQILMMVNQDLTSMDNSLLNQYYDIAVKEYRSVFTVDVDPSSSLTKDNFKSWLTEERKANIPKDYLNRYITYLRRGGRPESVIKEVERSSEEILGKIGDPQSPTSFFTKGLVVGNVQSGKTGNFNAVINRAIDSGYHLIIILSGIMEDLRSQTQIRLAKEVVGEAGNEIVGVGRIRRFGGQDEPYVPQVISITSSKSDFKRSLLDANFSLTHRNLLVCKKNTGVLKNLLIWLGEYLPQNTSQRNIPLLIIDDEADNASLNNLGHKGKEYASIINGHIRAILNLFSRRTYLGYTATPFANVIQDQNETSATLWPVSYKSGGQTIKRDYTQVDNIFPNDFIELLSPPSNYIGAKQIFETVADEHKKLPLVVRVADAEMAFPLKVIDEPGGVRPATPAEIEEGVSGLRSGRKEDLFPHALPQSLKDAIGCFVLAIALRLKRYPAMAGSALYNPHNTMLIHVSRFTTWQNRTGDLVRKELEKLTKRILNELPSNPYSIYANLERLWNQHFEAIVQNIRTVYLPQEYKDEFLHAFKYEDIKSLLPEAVKDMEVRVINSDRKEKLDYPDGTAKKYIAIGGNRLSRGFTLEGLTINYFIRNTNYADTLLQMGRWFGYRPGYIDCCRIFTTQDAIEKFDAVTRTVEELETTFTRMHRKGRTPNDFVLRVKNHPGVLKITRPAILKNAKEVIWSYSDQLEQTTKFTLNAERINEAWSGLRELIIRHKWTPSNDGNHFYTDTDKDGLFEFLDAPSTFYNYDGDLSQIKAFVRIANDAGKLKRWRIAVRVGGKSKHELPAAETGLPGKVNLTIRSGPKDPGRFRSELVDDGIFTGSGSSANIVTTGRDMALWLEDWEIAAAEKAFVAEKTAEGIKKNLSPEEAAKKAGEATKPERIYRERMSGETGLLVIYLMDMRAVLRMEEGEPDTDMDDFRQRKGIDEKVPLIGYALGFPKLPKDIGGHYVQGKYNIPDDPDEETDEADDETLYGEDDTQS